MDIKLNNATGELHIEKGDVQFFGAKEKYFEVLQKYKRINDITKIKIINYSEEIFDKYLKEEYEKVGYVFDLEKMIELFSKYKNIKYYS